MHLREAALVDQGDHVYTGQPIGFVGDTGAPTAATCTSRSGRRPGWYSGGSPIDPLPMLSAWDKTS